MLADAMSAIKNAEKIGKKEVIIKPVSKVVKQVIKTLHEHGYIKDYEHVEDHKGGKIKVDLRGRINNCGVIKPRYPCKYMELEEYEKRYLPAKNLGLIIISTPKGIMTHVQAKKNKTGGVLLAYVY